ncbi:MAG TPA: hypothetical protein VNR11_22165 [Xanthobacteraceae bacterium]|nr:hypothetical protein [Xanthobacteraceae bacterium]
MPDRLPVDSSSEKSDPSSDLSDPPSPAPQACPHCSAPMGLIMFEPAAMYGAAQDAFVFKCACGVVVRRPSER